ncbi:MAG: shikimate kinase, partial [Muribaculaceae bacterium]|nr:shikimate kinase [Muribaculaceae bacterium]
MTIFLIGYMASGKTTLGRALAARMGRPFIDLDFYIEQRYRKSVADIFAAEGETRFREIEREMLREV